MAQQRGMKRAEKVLKRKQTTARLDRKSNIKQAIYAFEKALKESQGEQAHEDHSEHQHK